MPKSSQLAEITQNARRRYADRVAGETETIPWWTAVLITANSQRQAERYREEIRLRLDAGKLPPGVTWLVVPDPEGRRIGSGGATIHAIRALAAETPPAGAGLTLEQWWQTRRVFLIHSGGDSRRLPEYSLSGKLFSALPVKTLWGDVSTVFDEMLALSTPWAARIKAGLVVSSGDVILTFPAEQLQWDRPGVCGAAMRQPAEVGSRHGVYVIGNEGRVYSFLQKPSAAEVRAAGGMLDDEQVALDIGLLRFDPATAARLTELAGVRAGEDGWKIEPGILGESPAGGPVIDLYLHITLGLTGEWVPGRDSSPALHALARALRDVPFWCSLVEGDFTHVGTTSHFHRLLTSESSFTRLYTAQQRLGAVNPPGVESAGVIVDSVLSGGGELGPGALVIECELKGPVRAGRNSILHGVTGIAGPIEVPEETVVHQVPVRLENGRRGYVVRVYGVQDDPKAPVAGGKATWFGRPILEVLEEAGLDPEWVWPSLPPPERSLWNAALFVFGKTHETWDCARWLMGVAGGCTVEEWKRATRLSLAASSNWADSQALAAERNRRHQASWQAMAVALAESGTDVRPLVAHAPGVAALAEAGRQLQLHSKALEKDRPTEAASRYFQAGLFLAQAGREREAGRARERAFRCVRLAVEAGGGSDFSLRNRQWRFQSVRVAAPARIDMGGGWSDTPPFCLDWGGTVLNIAVLLDGQYPIATTVRRLEEPCVRCISGEDGASVVYHTAEEILEPVAPGSVFAVPATAFRMTGIARPGEDLAEHLAAMGGGLEIRTEVNLPMGSGLGTSSILAATLLQALARMAGVELSESTLSDHVMRLEQLMTTGGGWQDQAGGIFPGAKLVLTGPGLRQRLRVQPLDWSAERQAGFLERFVLYYTGIRRVAKDLLAQVVGSYLAREVATVQVLHSIKTLAVEMSYAMEEGDWKYLGELLNRHWRLNQVLDPHTTNAPIDAVLHAVDPYISGAKLAGAGGGGFLMLLAKGPEEARSLRQELARQAAAGTGRVYAFEIAGEGLRVSVE